MQHLNLFRFYELATKLHGLFCVDGQSRAADMFGPLTEAQAALDSLIKGDPFSLESSKADAARLLDKVGELFDKYFIDPSTKQMRSLETEDRVNQREMAIIRTLLEKFEHALAAELNRAPSYIAEKCGIYSTPDLIERASATFSANHQKLIAPVALEEFDTAGRAIAFGLGTAAAVHLLRAIEIVLRQYFEAFVSGSSGKGERSYAIYLKKLSLLSEDEAVANKPDRRILQMLAQIKDQYRNPLLTPDSSVSLEQAVSLFGLASAIISMMADGLMPRKAVGKKDKAAPAEKEVEDEDETYDFRGA
jgi:hypothetical protein